MDNQEKKLEFVSSQEEKSETEILGELFYNVDICISLNTIKVE